MDNITRRDWLIAGAVGLVIVAGHFAVWLGGGHI